MGLDIRGLESGMHMRCGYGQFDYARYKLCLIYCGYPEDIGLRYNYEKVDPALFLMSPFLSIYTYTETHKKAPFHQVFSDFLGAVSLINYIFPNLNLHCDCDGGYTLNGVVDINTYLMGNLLGLEKELLILKEEFGASDEYKTEWSILSDLLDIVEEETKLKGTVTFG